MCNKIPDVKWLACGVQWDDMVAFLHICDALSDRLHLVSWSEDPNKNVTTNTILNSQFRRLHVPESPGTPPTHIS